MYDKFLSRLKEIREYEWNNYDIKICGEFANQKGVRCGETALEAIARHMVEVLKEELKDDIITDIMKYIEMGLKQDATFSISDCPELNLNSKDILYTKNTEDLLVLSKYMRENFSKMV